MTTLTLASEFLTHLKQSKLLTAAEIQAALEKLQLPPDSAADAMAKAFVKGGLLTRLQVTRLLEGRTRGFYIDHYRIEVPIIHWPDARSRWIRISAQSYNDMEQYQRLAEALIKERAVFVSR